MTNRKFKPGDRVRLLAGNIYSDVNIGDLATISSDEHGSSGWLLVDFDNCDERKGMEENSEVFELVYKTWRKRYETKRRR